MPNWCNRCPEDIYNEAVMQWPPRGGAGGAVCESWYCKDCAEKFDLLKYLDEMPERVRL